MKEEAEKEKIRRRLMLDQLMKGDRSSELEDKQKELERLRELEREIMKELALKPPSAFWVLLEKYTLSLGFAISAGIIMATGVAFYYVDDYMDKLAHEELLEAEASDEIKAVAPTVATAIEMQHSGNGGVMEEIAMASQEIRGGSNESREAIVGAASLMMKGVDPEKFMAIAQNMSMSKMTAQLSEGELQPAPVNIDTIGGVSGLQGLPAFSNKELMAMSPPLLAHGHEEILSVLTDKTVIKDVYDLDGPDLVVDAIDEMDGSAIVDLMSTISRDQEWDQFLLSHVSRYIVNADTESAELLADRIKNPVVRIRAFGQIMEEHLINGDTISIKTLNARVSLELDKIQDPDARAKVILELGKQMAAAGNASEPYDSIEKVSRMANDAEDPLEESFITSRLAVAYLEIDDQAQAKRLLTKAMRIAGRIPELSTRISAFTRIAQRYYDVRNNTLSAEILSEASVIAATDLEQGPRSIAFGEIAIAQSYVGDQVGARMSIDNAAEGEGKQQLLSKVAESLIGEAR